MDASPSRTKKVIGHLLTEESVKNISLNLVLLKFLNNQNLSAFNFICLGILWYGKQLLPIFMAK